MAGHTGLDCERQDRQAHEAVEASPTRSTRRRPVLAIVTFIVACITLKSILLSTPSASSAHGNSPFIERIQAIASFLHGIPSSIFAPYRQLASTKAVFKGGPEDTWPWPPPSPSTPCPFPLPNLLTHDPINPDNIDRPVQDALDSLHRYLQLRTSSPDIDSLAIAVVTPAGPIFERGYGVLKANDTNGKQYPVDKDSIYRIASVSKMFAVFEALVLRERGVLDLDDPVEKYIPDFDPPAKPWPEYLRDSKEGKRNTFTKSKHSRVTLRQLASHTSGIGRDYPVGNLEEWPVPKIPVPPNDGQRNSTFKNVLEDINKYPLINLPHSYPIYSNVGFGLLGLALVAANKKKVAEAKGCNGAKGESEPETYKELVQRDIVDAFGLNSSFFRIPDDEWLKDHIAVSAKYPRWANYPLTDEEDAAGGQYNSLSDLSKIAQIFLSPKAPREGYEFVPGVMREWLRPAYLWAYGGEAVGTPWEITHLQPHEISGFPGRPHTPVDHAWDEVSEIPPGAPLRGHIPRYPGNVPIYSKGGNMPGYHSIFSLNPEYGYAVIVLVTGTYQRTDVLAREAFKRLQPAFEDVLGQKVEEAYGGVWEAEREEGGKDEAEVGVVGGQLYLTKLVLEGVDVLDTLLNINYDLVDPDYDSVTHLTDNHLHRSTPAFKALPLWSTGNQGEFRIAIGRGGYANNPGLGACKEYWASIDFGAFARGASVDLVYWEEGKMVYPSAGVRLRKKGRS
ncbi:hypothetical protein NMY22_g1037 [Coprinellus aureogranulatus]|nr:hypothetical protein NMY22_g1037 [Coprinellus aureogranulatus]